MNVQTHRLFKDLLFLHGHVADPRLGADLASTEQDATDAATATPGTPEESPMNLFKSLWLLGGLESIDPRIGEDEETGFGPSYGNRIASERTFGKPRSEPGREARARRPIVANDQRIAHC